MSDDWKTLRVPTDAWETAKEQKEAAGRTWGEQIVRGDSDNDTTTDLTSLADAVETIEVRTGRIERELEDLQR
jgi:hypothetical protein